MIQFLVVALAPPLAVGIFVFPRFTLFAWVLMLECSPAVWAGPMLGRETIIAVMKGFGLVLAVTLIWRHGARWNKFNPAFGFLAIFIAGLAHGLYPGLSVAESARSFIGSAAPFLFSFIRLPPLVQLHTLAAGSDSHGAARFVFGAGHLHRAGGYAGTVWADASLRRGTRRAAAGRHGGAPFLAGFALTALYAALLDAALLGYITTPRRRLAALALLYLIIILLTGARAPLVLALLACGAVFLPRAGIMGIAAFGAACALVLMGENLLSFLRAVDLTQLGEASNLSNRTLIWPYFEQAIAQSPWLGWGLGAGKMVVPLGSPLFQLIGTNAAHNEYLRLGAEGGVLGLSLLLGLFFLWAKAGTAPLPWAQKLFMRLVFLLFAVHSMTDNTLIATTSSALFLWISCVFAEAENRATRAA